MKYQTPLSIENSIIYDANGRKVKLWGVNYYAPFNHNYFNIKEIGCDIYAAIDKDIAHFKLLDIDFLRMHLYEREITTPNGELVENEQLKVFDYLVEQCDKNDIYLMLSPISYWNTVKNQIMMDQQYAYWNIYSQDAFGFTNFYSIDSLLWNQEAINCQKRYLDGLFKHKNVFSGKFLNEYSNIIAWELINEMQFPKMDLLTEETPITPYTMEKAITSRGNLRKEFIHMWECFRETKPENTDEQKCFAEFRIDLSKKYLDLFWDIVSTYFNGNIIRCQFFSYSGVPDQEISHFLNNYDKIDAKSLGTYLNANGFDSANTDHINHREICRAWFEKYSRCHGDTNKAIVSYEFDATATQNGYPLAAIAAMYAKYNVQMAAFFTYTPYAVAAWNPGWLVHFMNIAHTPSRAACFAAAGKIFRNLGIELSCNDDEWHGTHFRIEKKNDFVSYLDNENFCYSNDNDIELKNIQELTYICGRGSSKLIQSDENSCYIMRKDSTDSWVLTIFPSQEYISDPTRGKAYRGMANRYVNCLKELPVSILKEEKIGLTFRMIKIKSIISADTGEYVEISRDGRIVISPGEYRINIQTTPTESIDE